MATDTKMLMGEVIQTPESEERNVELLLTQLLESLLKEQKLEQKLEQVPS